MTDKEKKGYKREWRKAKRTGEKKQNTLHFIFNLFYHYTVLRISF